MNGRWIVLAMCAAVGLNRAAAAAELKAVEFTPFYGYCFSGDIEDADSGEEFEIDDSACWGAILDIRVGESTQLEFFVSRQETELESEDGLFAGETLSNLDLDYYHIGGTYILIDGRWQPFVVATVGATHLDPSISGSDSLTRFSLGVGGGVRFFPTEHFGLYLAGRGLFTFVGTDTFVESDSGSLTVEIDGGGLCQVLLQVGAIFAF
ncbi:MAG TPA: hypothetical protein PKH24_02500 [Sedimentisphaerales bacterium]|jgi:opacity protein-like surface antigen|nr:hypothetical protein [Sedimentisphaerales bacterium]HNU28297.1 hypothetical protein [Sedimentisphaerales bacterium]